MTLAEPTPDMTEMKCFSNVLTARVLKSRWTEMRLVLLSRAFDPNTPIFNGENPNASYLRWPAWIIKFQNPQILDFNFSLQKLSSHKKRLKGPMMACKKHHLKVFFKEMQFVAFFIFHMGKTRMQVKNDLLSTRAFQQKMGRWGMKSPAEPSCRKDPAEPGFLPAIANLTQNTKNKWFNVLK